MKSFYLTDTGRVREHNEDSVTILKNISGEYLCVVADGMGGHRKGEVASALSVAHLGKRFTESASIGTKIDAVNWLSDNINEIKANLQDDDLLIITADHGNDPTYKGTDHTRENTPVIIFNKNFEFPKRLPNLETFGSIGATIADNFNLTQELGSSFLESLK